MSKASETITQAQAFLGGEIEFKQLDEIYRLQQLMGPVIAYKVLLEIAINGADAKEQRLAASKLLDATGDSPEQIANRLRESIFRDLTLEQLQAVVQTGITDPNKAVEALQAVKA